MSTRTRASRLAASVASASRGPSRVRGLAAGSAASAPRDGESGKSRECCRDDWPRGHTTTVRSGATQPPDTAVDGTYDTTALRRGPAASEPTGGSRRRGRGTNRSITTRRMRTDTGRRRTEVPELRGRCGSEPVDPVHPSVPSRSPRCSASRHYIPVTGGWFAADDRPPEPFRRVAHQASWRDRHWFAAQPGVHEYEREYVDGELWFDGEDFAAPKDIEGVSVAPIALVGLFNEDPRVRGVIRIRDSIPPEPPFSGVTDPEDAANWTVQDGPPT